MKKGIKIVVISLIIASLTIGVTISCGGGGQENKSQKAKKQQQTTETAQVQSPKKEFTPDPVKGKQLFLQVCAACHGPDAKGLPNLGKDLTNSKFVAEKTDQELLEFVKVGRSPTDPLNTTGIAMPPKGGNPALSDEDILHIIAYIRTLQTK